MYFRSAFARANVSGENVAHGSSSRGAPSAIAALPFVAGPAVGPLAPEAPCCVLAGAPGPAAQPTASDATITANELAGERISRDYARSARSVPLRPACASRG